MTDITEDFHVKSITHTRVLPIWTIIAIIVGRRRMAQLDAAATAFKKCARAASADEQVVGRTEKFRGRMGALGPRDWDLTLNTLPSVGGLPIRSVSSTDGLRAPGQ
jgi:hypothetical protein